MFCDLLRGTKTGQNLGFKRSKRINDYISKKYRNREAKQIASTF
jgi:hypothetical protein